MKIDGMDDWLKKIEILKKEFPERTEIFLKQKAEQLIDETKRNTPVKNGTLKSGWQRESDGAFRQIIFNNVKYSGFIEYGHRIVRGKKTVGFAKGRRMLHRGIAKVRMNFYRDLDKVYKNLIEK